MLDVGAVVPAAVEQDHLAGRYPPGLILLGAIAPTQVVDAGLANIVMPQPADEIVEKALAQCAIRATHGLNAEGLEYRSQDGDAAGEHRRALRLQAAQAAPLGGPRGYQRIA